MKIYIIDDDLEMVNLLRLTLESAGHRVADQNDGGNLVENITGFSPDIIILDVMFPGDPEAGFKMARLIRHSEKIKDIPILMLTSVNEEGDFLSTFSSRDIDDIYLPVTEFIEKPIEPRLLLQKVNELTA